MRKENTAIRLKKIMNEKNLKQSELLKLCEPICNKYSKIYKKNIKITKSDLSQWISGLYEPSQSKLMVLAESLNVSEAWLMGFDVPMENKIIAMNTNDEIILWDDLFGYEIDDAISIKNFCNYCSIYYDILMQILGMIENMYSTLDYVIAESKLSNIEKKALIKSLKSFKDISVSINANKNLNSNIKKQDNNLNYQIIEYFQLLSENEKLLHKAFSAGKITKENLEEELKLLKENFDKTLNNIQNDSVKFKVNFQNDNSN